MNQKEFFQRDDIIALIEIQKANPHGSQAHRNASREICDKAIQAGAPEDWRWNAETY